MVIRLNQRRGSVLLAIVVVVFVVIILGLTIRKVASTAQRLDGLPYRNGMYTNDESLLLPEDTPLACYFDNPRLRFEWDDTVPYYGLTTASPKPEPCLAVYCVMNTNGDVAVFLAPPPAMQRVTWASLGMPVTVDGMPADFSWSCGFMELSVGEDWQLESSTNFVDWSPEVTFQASHCQTNVFLESDTAAPVKAYRARKIGLEP